MPVNAASWILTLCVLFLTYCIYLATYLGRRLPNMPPGPPTIPVLGNVFDMPRERLHIKFAEFAKTYGDVFSLVILNQKLIVLNTPSLMRDVIERNSSSSSNRPKSILADMIIPNNLNMGISHEADATWKVMRKQSGQLLSKDSMKAFGDYQRAEGIQFIWELAHTPEGWYSHVKRYFNSFFLGIVYGIRAPTLSSPILKEFFNVHPKFVHALDLGTLPPVDVFPILTWVPERWAEWKRVVKEIKTLHESLYYRLLSIVETRLASGRRVGVFMEDMIDNADSNGLSSREHLMNLGAVLIQGTDNAAATLQNAVYCLVNFPHVLKRAREEVDAIVGHERLPAREDIPKLVYVLAFIEEVYRYRPTAPAGVPRAMVRDEVINGVLYPKDAIVFVNIWSIFHDERYFDLPDQFIPERFLTHPLGIKAGVMDDPARRANIVFGGGRRVCPGIVAAKQSLEMNIVNLIWAFNFEPAVNSEGGKIWPSLDDHATGFVANPREYPVKITPRSSHYRDLIDKEFSALADVLSKYESEVAEEDRVYQLA